MAPFSAFLHGFSGPSAPQPPSATSPNAAATKEQQKEWQTQKAAIALEEETTAASQIK
jgi:hypothetical protein